MNAYLYTAETFPKCLAHPVFVSNPSKIFHKHKNLNSRRPCLYRKPTMKRMKHKVQSDGNFCIQPYSKTFYQCFLFILTQITNLWNIRYFLFINVILRLVSQIFSDCLCHSTTSGQNSVVVRTGLQA